MELHFKTFGQGTPLIILHGLFGTLDNWQTIGKQLAEHFQVFLIDQRNHGRSPHTDVIDFPTMAQDLYEFLDTHQIFKTHVLGHSMGGKTAMQFALEHPEALDKLVVVDVAPKRYSGGHEQILGAILALDLNQVQNRSDAEQFFRQRLPHETEGTIQFLMKNLSRNPEGGFEWKMNFPAIYNHYQDILAPVEVNAVFNGEALFIRGDRSDYVQDADWANIVKLFPKAQLKTVENAGHWVHADQPQVLLEMVQKFFT
jgi:pimeloyl-ACP methyl ester carboxylesterase